MSPRLGRKVARFNRRFTSHVTRPFAGRLPGFGVVVHTGRRSRRTYRTPVNVFGTADGYAIALTYGVEADWVRNVLAQDGCEIVTRGRSERLTAPRIVHDETLSQVPRPVRPILRLLSVSDFLQLGRARAPE